MGSTFEDIDKKVNEADKNHNSQNHGKIYDQVSINDFDLIISADWVETISETAEKLTFLRYETKEVYVRVKLTKPSKGKIINITYKEHNKVFNTLLQEKNYNIISDDLIQYCAVKFTIDDYIKEDEDYVSHYIFEIKLDKQKYKPEKKLEVHAVIYIPEIMKKLQWHKGAEVQDRWFRGEAIQGPEKGVPSIGSITMTWINSFARVKEKIYENLHLWTSDNGLKQLKKEIKKMKEDGVISFPTSKNKIVTFGIPNTNIKYEKNGEEIIKQNPMFDEYYYQSFVYKESLWTTVFSNLDDFYATIANTAFRFIASGFLEFIDEQTTMVNINIVYLYMRDGFDFEGDQPLGYWSLKDKKVSKSPGKSYRSINNETYRNYRDKAGKGGDFFNYSDFQVIPVSKRFNL